MLKDLSAVVLLRFSFHSFRKKKILIIIKNLMPLFFLVPISNRRIILLV